MDRFEEGVRALSRAAEQNGKSKMQHAVCRWLLANRTELSQGAIDSLIAQMNREMEACEPPPQSPPA